MPEWVFPTVGQILLLHEQALADHGGLQGVREPDAIRTALELPDAAFGGVELYPTLGEKAAALGYSLIRSHPFVDGNKRVSYLAMEAFLVLNGFELSGGVDTWEDRILRTAAGQVEREEFTGWVCDALRPLDE